MHVPDGFVPVAVAGGAYVVTGAISWYSLRRINKEPDPRAQVPKAALLTAAFFISSLIHIPVPPVSLHLVLSGLMGVILGYYAFPAILIGLVFQAIMFQHGGLTTLGLNALIMGFPAILAHHLFQLHKLNKKGGNIWLGTWGFIAGALGLGFAVLLFVGIMVTFIPAGIDAATERSAILTASTFYLPIIAIEGFFTALLVTYLNRVKPELLGGLHEVRA